MVVAFLMFVIVVGILMAFFLNIAGGVWDNVKKYIEIGVYGGKGSEVYKVVVLGDMVGDLFKDIVGLSIYVLIKMFATIILVMVSMFFDVV